MNYVHTDLLGSPINGKAGSTSYAENYTPWGEKLDNPIPLADDVGYTGHQSDVATGLTYMQARYYDPVVGRFLAVDPVGFTAGNPMTFNRYSYVNNNPFKFTDPTGMTGITGKQQGAGVKGDGKCEAGIGCAHFNLGAGTWEDSAGASPQESKMVCTPASSYESWTENAAEVAYFAGLAAMEAEHSIYTVGTNGKIYPGWRGGSPARISTYRLSEAGKFLGKATVAMGVVLDSYGVSVYYLESPSSRMATHPAKAGANLGFGLYGMINPATFATSALYFGVDLLHPGGWEGAMQTNDALVRGNQAILGTGWQLHPRGGGN